MNLDEPRQASMQVEMKQNVNQNSSKIHTYHTFLQTNVTCSSYSTCNLLSSTIFCHTCNLMNILLLRQNLFQLVPVWFQTISWLFFTFSILFFNHPRLLFNIITTWFFTCLNARGWFKYSNPMCKAFLIASNSSLDYLQMSTMAGFNLTSLPLRVVNHPFLPPPIDLAFGLQCTKNVTSLPWITNKNLQKND